MLSAQCRDDRVNEVTKELFAVAPDPASMAELPVERIAEIIRTCGLYRNKSENLSACAKKLVDEFGAHTSVGSRSPKRRRIHSWRILRPRMGGHADAFEGF